MRKCYTCKEDKPLTREFWYMRRGQFKRQCKPCEKEYMARWKEDNPTYKEEWYIANAESIKARVTQWMKDNPDKVAATMARREDRKRTNGQYDPDINLPELIVRDNGVCWLCGKLVDVNAPHPSPYGPSIDHRQRIADGGAHSWDNVSLAHLICNMKRPKPRK